MLESIVRSERKSASDFSFWPIRAATPWARLSAAELPEVAEPPELAELVEVELAELTDPAELAEALLLAELEEPWELAEWPEA